MKKTLLLLSLAILCSNCEKDDVCTDETTPRLVLEFYDISNPANVKNVLNLKVKGVGASDFIVFNKSLSQTDGTRYLFNGSKLQLPLNISQDLTQYSLILNSTVLIPDEDLLQFNYIRQNIFVSRACGYKTIFELNASPNGVIKTDSAVPTGYWIKDINILTSNIVTENETHIKIYW
ncbi:DUF6452 family protein [Flavobacterium sp.]|uniref:DUF6452 family protein n=1 Tax=Flavobacterium sp. TaxID=239 RepID=UPI0025ECDCF6|nr:DUF6452 family protein [Flavobacterium sp.]